MKTGLFNKLKTYDFEELFKKKGYAYFTNGNYNLNIIVVRSNNGNKVTNLYDDFLVVIYKTSDEWTRKIYTITTEPGRYYMMQNIINPKGTAILKPNQYRGCWQIAKHKGKYKALCQKKAVQVYRDNNKNNVYDLLPRTLDTGIFGINIHRSSQWATRETVDKYSAGCQVFNDPTQFNSFMRLCEKQKELYGNSFTYTLLDENDL